MLFTMLLPFFSQSYSKYRFRPSYSVNTSFYYQYILFEKYFIASKCYDIILQRHSFISIVLLVFWLNLVQNSGQIIYARENSEFVLRPKVLNQISKLDQAPNYENGTLQRMGFHPHFEVKNNIRRKENQQNIKSDQIQSNLSETASRIENSVFVLS